MHSLAQPLFRPLFEPVVGGLVGRFGDSTAPAPTYTAALKFNDSRNSQFIGQVT